MATNLRQPSFFQACELWSTVSKIYDTKHWVCQDIYIGQNNKLLVAITLEKKHIPSHNQQS